MTITEDLRKTLTDPTPLYAVAGTADLAAEKLREVPALLEKIREEAPERIAAVRATDPKAVQTKVTERAKAAQAKVTEVLGTIEVDAKQWRETAQDFALQQFGRAAEAAVRARETYDELAERGRGVVSHWRGEAAEQNAAADNQATAIAPHEAGTAPVEEPKPADEARSAVRRPAPRKPAPRKAPTARTTP